MDNGLYDQRYEHDACGIGMVVNIRGDKSHGLVSDALKVLENMMHRGAEGADGKSGDGAGIMIQIPHEFILLQGIPVPEKGKYGTGIIFLPENGERKKEILAIIKNELENAGLNLMFVRDVPVNSEELGAVAASTEPDIKQLFVTGFDNVCGSDDDNADDKSAAFERCLYRVRKHVERLITDKDFYICSLSGKYIIYKGMLTSKQLRNYYSDLSNDYLTSGLALVHSRFSTNTFPAWSLAQPFRLLCHNGEINTIRGNRNWMKARESVLGSGTLGDIKDITPIVQPGMSDSASLDNVLEFLLMSGLSLPQAMSVLVPESVGDKSPMSEDLKAYYEYHSILMEPWDGPAALLFSDGRYAGGMLDRNGLRPARYVITKSGYLVVASEVGVMDIDPADIVEKGRLEPGKMLMADTKEGKIYYDGEIKSALAHAHPYRKWLSANRIRLEKIKSGKKVTSEIDNLFRRELLFSYGKEDIDNLISPMCLNGIEPTASMGNDTPLAVLSEKPQIFFNYFRQQFAQVTNPAIDSIREELVMSLTEYIGRVGTGILNPDESNCKMVRLPHPILTNKQLDILCNIRYKGFNTIKLPILFEIPKNKEDNAASLEKALDDLCRKAEKAVEDGFNYIILSDREVDENHAVIPSLLAVSAVHHYLISSGKRVQTALIVESGEIRETMHAALLLGYGASALNPYMTYAVIDSLVRKGSLQENYQTAEANYISAVKKGLLKIMAKMGISTIRSYRGAKIFESIGLGDDLLRKYFGTETSSIGGIGLGTIARDAISFHNKAFAEYEETDFLKNEGLFHFRKDGIRHAWNPETISTLQLATRMGSYKKFKEFTSLSDNVASPVFLRDLLDFRRGVPIDINEVEPVENIVRHFVTGAMSFGALSIEAHEAIALAMNKLGARSNTGEGGEDNVRFHSSIDGIPLSSKIKQVASGRFGVTTEYLVNAEEIQIKVAQGAKPGEGGQLPGYKVNEVIAKTRNSIPGISLISPPPHHDIYSIEDLAQLIYDLRNVNPKAAISVKLVAEKGVGTIAAGVVKAKADLIVISGAEGGTGASPSSSMRFAGVSPEIGLAEAQQTLVRNGLRGQVRLQTDGEMKTGRDVIIMSLLGADEVGFGTSALIVLGCVMMRKCSLNTCPTGIATQNPELRKHFIGRYQYLVNYFTFLAEEIRGYLAEMGFTRLEDIVGRTDLLVKKDIPENTKAGSIDLSRLLYMEKGDSPVHYSKCQLYNFTDSIDKSLIEVCSKSGKLQGDITLDYKIKNTDRAVGAGLSGKIAMEYGESGLESSSVKVRFTGSAGQSFGAFLVKGVDFRLEGETNDYFGKGLSGGRIAITPPAEASFSAEDNIIAGNTGLYGATGGEIYINGRVGERFAVRNSGAVAVAEGAGDHCCEYMTGGRVVILGPTGRNFAAGMSGGIAYVWDRERHFDYYCNMDMVEISLVEDSVSRRELYELIGRHYKYTGSPLARKILDGWNDYVDDFIQVVPLEYKKVLEEERVRVLQQKVEKLQREF
ncbi:MAG: glutamate synthase large subunit [Bacteroidales bacterium]|jgi:glutamate synthase (NADPH/NADH) large chain|nr:glutamate synthase large subunit [Bacteroidales bacterium]